MHSEMEAIAAIATPPGEGGIAVIRVSGAGVRKIAAQIFRPARPGSPLDYSGYSVHYGQFIEPETGDIADDGLLTVFRAPHSYTGEDTLELSCHGGRTTTQRVLHLAVRAGARLAEPGEFTRRAFLNGRLDLAQAEAVCDLIRARTDAAQRMARRQLDGTLSRAMADLREELVGILAAIEVTIDFSEEVGDLDYDALLPRIQSVRQSVEGLLASAERGRILREGLRVAIVGRPNVGKSSLLNALLGTERAIVTPIAGTTRDLVEEGLNLSGVPVVLTDTAGLRDTDDAVEKIGVQKARETAANADVTLLVLDATAGFMPEDAAVAAQLATGESAAILTVWNKCDALKTSGGNLFEALPETLQKLGAALRISALTGAGLPELAARILQSGAGEMSASPDSVVVSNVRHRTALEAAQRSLIEAEGTATARLPGDFVAIDVRGALDAIGQITGETVTEDIIHRIFHDFCVGK